MVSTAFVRSVTVRGARIEAPHEYPFGIPAVRALIDESLEIDPKVTFFVGENGSGKSTLIEAIAVACRFNAEGGSQNFAFTTHGKNESSLREHLVVARGARRERTGFFLRAESMFNVATEIERLGVTEHYGDRSLHEQSHGESFLALVNHRFGANGLYILDEPEAALSPQRQLALLSKIHDLVEHHASQMLIATHSPILLAYPGATIYHLDGSGIAKIAYEDTEHYQITKSFLANPATYFKHLFQ